MKQFNDITIIGIDQGYGNMKTANTIFPTAITAYDTAPMFKGDVLEYGGKFYRVGEGHKGFVADKSTDGDFYPDAVSGLAYCKRCRSPRRTRQMLFGKERILPIGCRCQMEDAAFVQSSSTNGDKQRQNFSPKTQTPKQG